VAIDLDTTVKPLYGRQEDARIGYNPHKAGRPSHAGHALASHPAIVELTESLLLSAMAGFLGLLVGLWAKDCFVAIYPSELLISNRVFDPFVLRFLRRDFRVLS
jgi:hypothetical protein